MVLSYTRLKEMVLKGLVLGVPDQQINGASIDVTLGKKVFIEAPSNGTVRTPLSFRDREPLPTNEYDMDVDGFILHPGQFCLAQTEQVFNMPLDTAAHFMLKSSAARIGLENLHACWCDPGWHGSVLTLELVNCTRYTPIRLRPGDSIGQMVFHQLTDRVNLEDSYAVRGRYNRDKTVSGIKP